MNYIVHVQPSGYFFSARDDETVLTAALRQGFRFPYSCQQAICGMCKGRLIEGQVKYEVPITAITDAERELGYAVFCSAKPLSDLIIYLEGMVEPAAYPTRRVTCDVLEYNELSGHVSQVILAQPEEPLAYMAGQYIEILHLDTSPKPFSIANAPNAKTLELHIRHLPHNEYALQLIREIKTHKPLKLFGPFGGMTYQREPAYPLLFVAGGTGFAPFKSIIEQVLREPHRPSIYVYWGARTRADLYWYEQIELWSKQHQNFYFIPILSQPLKSDYWQGETGLVHEIILQQHTSLAHFHVYASGPPEMVYAAQKAFIAKGMLKQYFYSDLLDYLPK